MFDNYIFDRLLKKSSILFLFLICYSSLLASEPKKMCSYKTYKWNTLEKRAVEIEKVHKRYQDLNSSEKDTVTGCTVCEQDQVRIEMPPLKPFRLCYLLASDIEAVIKEAIASGELIQKVEGYRVGMTRGETDEQGNRTRFSNHSFGIAIDINPDANGLYDNCVEYNAACRLIRGGHWQPSETPGSLTAQSKIVLDLKQLGFKWGGEIAGKQKDFMHFSPTGY